MSPRPRTVSDERIFAATAAAITRLGPNRLTLADVAGGVGLSAAALVQRFGSKRQLLLSFLRQGVGMIDERFSTARAMHVSPLAALVSVATSMAAGVRLPRESVNHLALLQIDVSDPEFRRPARDQSRHLLAGYESLLRDAIAAGELVDCDVQRVACALQAVSSGSLLAWAVNRGGRAMPFVTRDVETLLLPLRTKKPGRSRRSGASTRRAGRGTR